MRIGKIDWSNHTIGFFSALFGILIAFELDEWRETRSHREEARNAFDKLKQEIQINKNSLHTSVTTNLQLLDLLENGLLPHINDKLQYIGTAKAATVINSKIKTIARIDLNDTTSSTIHAPVVITMGSLLHPILHYSAWESAKTTGVINYIDYEKVLTISYVYNASRITEELAEIKMLLRQANEINTKAGLEKLVARLKKSIILIQSELTDYDTFVRIIANGINIKGRLKPSVSPLTKIHKVFFDF